VNDYGSILNKLKEGPPRQLNDHILIIDAMNMLIRSFALIKSMNPEGHHTGGFLGFLRSLGYMTRMFYPTRVIVVWDGKGGSGNRKNIDSNYKAQRATARITHWGLYDTKEQETEALIGQLYRTQDYLECLPLQQLQMEKLEADDIIAYLALKIKAGGKKCTIVSSDKDFLQLVDSNIQVYAPVKKKVFTPDNLQEELGVIPENYNIIKALTGDKSDNLSGVRGLGIKTILKEFPAVNTDPFIELDYIYDVCAKKLEGDKVKKVFINIVENWDKVETNYQLMNLHETVLDDGEKQYIVEEISKPVPPMQTGGFLSMLQHDKVESITKSTESWLENFRGLIGVKK